MRALVISGGGAKGAFAGGVAQNLIEQQGRKYDMFLGTSTGSLLITHLALGEINRLKNVFSSVRQSDVFDVCPFIIRRTGDKFKSRINHWGIFWQFVQRRKTFGESRALRNLLKKSVTKDDFERAKDLKIPIVTTVSNLTRNRVEYKYLSDCTYDEFLDWIWISCNMVPFMTLAKRNKCEYGDGGFGNIVPIQEAINLGAKDIDVIVLSPRHKEVRKAHSSNAMGLLLSSMDFMLDQIRHDDIFIGNLESIYNDVNVKFIYTPRKLTDNSFIFAPDVMSKWWEEGFEYANSLDK